MTQTISLARQRGRNLMTDSSVEAYPQVQVAELSNMVTNEKHKVLALGQGVIPPSLYPYKPHVPAQVGGADLVIAMRDGPPKLYGLPLGLKWAESIQAWVLKPGHAATRGFETILSAVWMERDYSGWPTFEVVPRPVEMDAAITKASQPVLHAWGHAVAQDTRLGPTKALLDAKAAESGGAKIKREAGEGEKAPSGKKRARP